MIDADALAARSKLITAFVIYLAADGVAAVYQQSLVGGLRWLLALLLMILVLRGYRWAASIVSFLFIIGGIVSFGVLVVVGRDLSPFVILLFLGYAGFAIWLGWFLLANKDLQRCFDRSGFHVESAADEVAALERRFLSEPTKTVEGVVVDVDSIAVVDSRSRMGNEAALLTYRYTVSDAEGSQEIEGKQIVESTFCGADFVGQSMRVKYLVGEPKKSVLEGFELNSSILMDGEPLS